MTYYSHSKLGESGATFGSKKLYVHINGVKENALFHFAENLSLGYSSEELKELLEIVIDFHDLGKYTSYFQNYLLNKEPIDFLLKRHAQLGGFVAYNYLEKEEKKALLAMYLIFLHHSPLLDILEISCKLGNNLEQIITKQKEDIEKALPTISEDVGIKNLNEFLFYSEEKKLRKGFKYWGKKYASIQDYFLINYLFSLLIEGDKLDASDTVPYSLQPIKPAAVDDRFGKPTTQNKSLKELDNNELRNYCRAVVVSNLEQQDILEHYIFTLTAPTGIGKTMTALDFSLKLKDKIKQESGIESRIIYALPFINIIEQSLNEYQKVLDGQNVNILGHYQYADVFGKNGEQKENVDGSEQGYDQKLMALDTWQADIIITSFVQFFETLISNRNKLLKKFNHFANAIIILDEVQTLRLDQMPLLGAALFYLSKFLKSRIILMTATRPKIFELAEQEILKAQNEKVVTKELLTNYEEVFLLFERTAIYPLLNDLTEEKENRTQEFVSSIFDKKWSTKKSCLIVCNTVNRSVEVFDLIKTYLNENDLGNPIYYLSTNIIPAHRLKRIDDIQKDIKQQKAPILIATQVVEAGVDLDFDMGFRDIGPIDSIIQVAGRINRNNNPKKTNAPLYIIDFDPKATTMVYGRLTYIQAKKSLKMEDCFYEREYLKLITEYFNGISEKSSFADARTFFNSMQTLKYDADDKKTMPVSAFRIIEESDRYAVVFIEIDDCATEILEKYLQKITNEISKEEFNKKWKLKFQQHIISVPKYLCEDLETVNEYEDSILRVLKEEIESRYNIETGYNRNYKEENTTYVF